MKPIAVAITILALTLAMANIKPTSLNVYAKTTVSKAAYEPQKLDVDNEPHTTLATSQAMKEKPNGTNKKATSKSSKDEERKPAAKPVAPDPPKSTPAAPANSGSIQSLIRQHAVAYNVDLTRAFRIAGCESTTGADLVNEHWTAPDGSNPTGVYQYTLETWYDFARQRGWPQVDERLNNTKNIEMTMWAWTHGYAGRWECQ